MILKITRGGIHQRAPTAGTAAWQPRLFAATLLPFTGEMSEWLKERDWKSRKRATVSGVRIPLSPLEIARANRPGFFMRWSPVNARYTPSRPKHTAHQR